MDTEVITTRLRRLDGYARILRQMQSIQIDSAIVHTHLAEELADFEQFAQEIIRATQ